MEKYMNWVTPNQAYELHSVQFGNVVEVLRVLGAGFDVILMDVENGHEGLIQTEHDRRCAPGSAGRRTLGPATGRNHRSVVGDAGRRLRALPKGDPPYTVEVGMVRLHRGGGGVRQTLWFAQRHRGSRRRRSDARV
jgi:hypothetical protein